LSAIRARAGRFSREEIRSEEHTSELQSHLNLVCRLLLEKKKKTTKVNTKRDARTLMVLCASAAHVTPVPCTGDPSDVRLLCVCSDALYLFFFLNNAAPPEISPFPPPDALPT